jgi:site-specific DNA-methyltransferase (adenine-specific)
LDDFLEMDCLKGMKDFHDEEIDLIVTSPPYNLNIQYGEYKDNKTKAEYLDWMDALFCEMKRILKTNDGSFWLNMGYTNIDPMVGIEVCQIAQKHFTLQNHFIWVKSIVLDNHQHGHFKPINSNRFSNPTWEHLFHFTKTGNVILDKNSIGVDYVDNTNDPIKRESGKIVKQMNFKNKRDFEKRATKDEKEVFCQLLDQKLKEKGPKPTKHDRGNTWFIPYDTIRDRQSERGKHPATFPVSLVEDCIKISGKFGSEKILLDPFMGTGTSAVAAKSCGMKFIGFDIDSEYVAFARKRLQEIVP